jgi:hypothetical protein
MTLSTVAGILDQWGGIRFVVAEFELMFAHVNASELCFLVTEDDGSLWMVQEPVPWEAIPYLTSRTRKHIERWMESRNDPEDLNHPCISAYMIRTEFNKKQDPPRPSIHIPDLH